MCMNVSRFVLVLMMVIVMLVICSDVVCVRVVLIVWWVMVSGSVVVSGFM